MATTEKSNVTLIVYPPRRPHRCCLPSTPSPSSTSRRHLPYQCRVHGSVVFKALVMFGEQGHAVSMVPAMQIMVPFNVEAEERVREMTDHVLGDNASEAGSTVRKRESMDL
ncbi:hypothetical protein FB107DRAFT_280002 [Schizophyllum commune]